MVLREMVDHNAGMQTWQLRKQGGQHLEPIQKLTQYCPRKKLLNNYFLCFLTMCDKDFIDTFTFQKLRVAQNCEREHWNIIAGISLIVPSCVCQQIGYCSGEERGFTGMYESLTFLLVRNGVPHSLDIGTDIAEVVNNFEDRTASHVERMKSSSSFQEGATTQSLERTRMQMEFHGNRSEGS